MFVFFSFSRRRVGRAWNQLPLAVGQHGRARLKFLYSRHCPDRLHPQAPGQQHYETGGAWQPLQSGFHPGSEQPHPVYTRGVGNVDHTRYLRKGQLVVCFHKKNPVGAIGIDRLQRARQILA